MQSDFLRNYDNCFLPNGGWSTQKLHFFDKTLTEREKMNDENNLEEVPDDEGQSIDPFDSEASDDDESSDIVAEAPVDNRKFEKERFLEYGVLKNFMIKHKRMFHENDMGKWRRFENLQNFEDQKFDPSKLSPSIGYRRSEITQEMLDDPYKLHEFIYGSSRSGRAY